MEWCLDWWFPYSPDPVTDPLGPEEGEVRVARNGDWWARLGPDLSAEGRIANPPAPEDGIKRDEYWWALFGPDDPENPRSRFTDRSKTVPRPRVTDRSGTVPGDRRSNLGFRVVRAPMPEGTYRSEPKTGEVFRNVSQSSADWKNQESPDEPVFFTCEHIIPPVGLKSRLELPYFSRHHVPNLTWCDNGDLLLNVFTASADYSDQGETWPVRKLIPTGPRSPWDAERGGGMYMDIVQTPDKIIHMVSSSRYYRFNLPWLRAPMHSP